jgi:predicted XRE-type DNA-binding protein
MATKIRRSTGNVFRDLDFDAEEGENLKLRSDLMIALSKIIKARRLTQVSTPSWRCWAMRALTWSW